jgi:transcriptional antiterminator NusG
MSEETTPADAPTPDPTTAPTEQAATDAVSREPTEPVAVADATHEQSPAAHAEETHTALPATDEYVALPEQTEDETPVAADLQHAPEPEAEPEQQPEAQQTAENVAETTEQTSTDDTQTPDSVATEEPPTEPAPAKTPKPRKPRAKKKADEEPAEVATTDETAAATTDTPSADGTTTPPATDSKKQWYVVKIQSGREESIKAAIERKVKIEGLEEFYGQIAIPVEEFVEKKKVRVTDKKTGEKVTQEKNVTKARKKYPGYLFAEVEFNDRILYLFRETSGVGDFVGATGPMKPPPPMSEREVQQMLTGVIDPKDRGKQKKTIVKLDIAKGDKVKIRDGAFAGSEGEVKSITEPKDPTDTPKVTVTVTIWGRPVELELDYWHVDKA